LLWKMSFHHAFSALILFNSRPSYYPGLPLPITTTNG
jgi:hypothetical protein